MIVISIKGTESFLKEIRMMIKTEHNISIENCSLNIAITTSVDQIHGISDSTSTSV